MPKKRKPQIKSKKIIKLTKKNKINFIKMLMYKMLSREINNKKQKQIYPLRINLVLVHQSKLSLH